jgi:hypothetical protein
MGNGTGGPLAHLGLGLAVVERKGPVDGADLLRREMDVERSDVGLEVSTRVSVIAFWPGSGQTHSTFRPPRIGYT